MSVAAEEEFNLKSMNSFSLQGRDVTSLDAGKRRDSLH